MAPNDAYWYLERLGHFSAYRYVKAMANQKTVLDIGSGRGYGAHYLSHFASSVIALDISTTLIQTSHAIYRKENVAFMASSGLHLPIKDASMDAVFSFQVIEHIEPKRIRTYLDNIKRVLRPGGVFIASTPNRKLRLLPFQKPWNPEHRQEYDATAFKKALHTVFDNVTVRGIHGSTAIQDAVRKRVRQKPLPTYVFNPLKALLKKALPHTVLTPLTHVKRHIAPYKGSRPLLPIVAATMWLRDFTVSSHGLDTCLDLYGICIKDSV